MSLVLTQKHTHSQLNKKTTKPWKPKNHNFKVKIVLLLVLTLGCQSAKSNSESQLTVTARREKLLQDRINKQLNQSLFF